MMQYNNSIKLALLTKPSNSEPQIFSLKILYSKLVTSLIWDQPFYVSLEFSNILNSQWMIGINNIYYYSRLDYKIAANKIY